MKDSKQDLLAYQGAVQKIKNAILQSRYRTASNANAELLKLYYGIGRYISVNTRSGKWGTGAIDAISERLSGELPGLHGFSPSNMKNMRMFYEQWAAELEPNRQLCPRLRQTDGRCDIPLRNGYPRTVYVIDTSD